MDFDFIGSCGRKHKFKTRTFAQDVLDKGEKSGKFIGCHVYLCNFCLLFHIGHIPPGLKDVKTQKINFSSVRKGDKIVPGPLTWVEDGFTWMNVPKKSKSKYKMINSGWNLVNKEGISFLRKQI